MPALKIYGRRWHTTTDMVPVPCILGSVFHGAWVVIFICLVQHFHIWGECAGSGTHYVVTTAGLMAVFVLCLVGELVLAILGVQGTPLEISKRRFVVPILYAQSIVWTGQIFFMLYGTVVVASLHPNCGTGNEPLLVHRIASAMVWSTWIFSVILGLTIFVVYNAYPARTKTETWEKRLSCISWVFGCYKTMMQQVNGRSAPLTSVAQWMSGLFGHADLTPSDLIAALVLTAAAQQQRRRLRIKNALGEKLDTITEASSQPSAGANNGRRDDGAQMYTGIDSRTLNKKTSSRGSSRQGSNAGSPSGSRNHSRKNSNEDGPRPGLQSPRNSDVHSTPSSALRNSQESKRKVDVNHEGHMEAITERSEGDARSLRHNSSSGRTHDRSLPHNSSGKESNRSLLHGSSGKDSNHSLLHEQLSGKESTSSLQQIREGQAESNGMQGVEAAHGNQPPQDRSSMNSAIIDLLTTKSHANANSRRRSSGEEPVVGDPPAQEDPLQGHLPNGSPANEEEFENGIATDSGDQPGEEPHLESVSNVPQNAEEEPILGDPPSREDSLLGHMPSANPAAQKEFDDAIATVSGNQQGGQQRLERVSEGPQHTELSQSRDGESAISNDARQGSAEQSSRSRSSGDGQRERQSLGRKPNASGGSSMSREEIQDHAEHILERMRGESHHIPTKKEKKKRRKAQRKSGDGNEEETGSEGEGDTAEQGASLDIKRGIMKRLEHLDSHDNYRDPVGEPRRSSGSELRESRSEVRDSQEHSPFSDADQSPDSAEAQEESSSAENGEARQLNPYSSMKKEPEKAPGIMDKVRLKAESLGVISSSSQKESEGDSQSEKRKLKAPDADTMLVKLPAKEHSGSIGPIWNDAPSTSKDSQAGGASRLVEEKRIAAEESPCEADNPSDVMTRMGNYLGSWLGLGSVPEHEGPGGESPKQKGERALKPKYSTQASAAADGRDLDDEVDVEKGLPEQPDSKQPGKVTGDMKTISLSQVDAPTLAEFERKVSEKGLEPSDFRRSGQFPAHHRISHQYPVVITPSEQVSEEVEELNIDMEPGDIVDDILGRRKSVAFLTLKEAADYARFACAAYAVFEHEDKDKTDEDDNPIENQNPNAFGCCCKPRNQLKTYATVIREIAEVAGIDEKDILYISPSNEALAHLPYMIALDRKRKAVVLALRGTMSMADIVTDAVAHPENIDDWLPPHFAKETNLDQGRAWGHAGIVAAASAVLADLEKGGILKTLLGDKADRREALGGEDGGTEGAKVGAEMQKEIDTKGYKLVVTGHSLGAGAAALISLKLRDNFEDLKCWAFSPPGGLVSESLLPALREWCISVVCGKDAVPRMTTNNLARLMDEMITALARSRHHKLRVLVGGWWRKSNRPAPQDLFLDYDDIPKEPRLFLESYYKSSAHREKERDMYPPGRVIFIRPLKQLVGQRHRAGPRRLEKGWDAVWVTPKELIAEGILISGKMLRDHLIQSTIISALDKVIQKHPANPKPFKKDKRRRLRKKGEENAVELAEVVVDGPESQAPI